MYKAKQLNTKNFYVKIRGEKPQDKKTPFNAIRFRINQEIKFLYRNEHFNQRIRVYHLHLESAQQYKGMFQHIQEYIDEQINMQADNIYHKLNKKLYAIINQPNTIHSKNEKPPKFQPRLFNLTNVKFTKEKVQTSSLGLNYAVEKERTQAIH